MGAQQTVTMPLKIEEPICIAATGDVCGEGVLWERDTQSVYWTDINRFLVHRYALKDSALKTWFFSEPVTCVMETNRKDTLVLSLGSGIALWNRAALRRPFRYSLFPAGLLSAAMMRP